MIATYDPDQIFDVLHTTTVDGYTVRWRIVRQRYEIQIVSLLVHGSDEPAHWMRLNRSTVDIPGGTRGLVNFGEESHRPDLAWLRETYPALWDLCNTVKAQFWAKVAPPAGRRVDVPGHLRQG